MHEILEVAKAGESPKEMSERSRDTSAEDAMQPEAESLLDTTNGPAEEVHPESEADEVGDGTEPPARSTRSQKKKLGESPS